MTWTQVRRLLRKWRKNPSIFADPGVVDPFTEVALLKARIRANSGQHVGERPPRSIIADPNGGIVFEWADGYEWHVFENGEVRTHV